MQLVNTSTMNTRSNTFSFLAAASVAASVFTSVALAQPAARSGRGPQAPSVVSPEISPERKLTFRILAPKAESVRLSAGDLPGLGQNSAMTKGTNGVWEVTVGPVNPGAYRYNFNVDGVSVIDPRNPATSEANENTWSLVHVPGAGFMDTRDVPHGAVAEVTYYSTTLQRFRRLHVYTPPGYESGKGKFPVLYLLHGAFDCDDSWSTVGRAGFILDNLIAAKKARPMIVVMPAGHTGPFRFGASFGDEFERDFVNDIMPLVEKRYRVRTDRNSRALAGLSMGGAQTLNIGMAHLDKFAHLGVYSSGVFNLGSSRNTNAPAGPTWEEKNKAALDNPKLKKGLRLVWFATGKDDFLLKTSQATVEMLRKHGFDVIYQETDGAHTWIKWRDYLNEFAPQLFQ
jgi:enterochelin esterase family protein